jgi:hypothetical protein
MFLADDYEPHQKKKVLTGIGAFWMWECWAGVGFYDLPCRKPIVSDLGLCGDHREEFQKCASAAE